jgi:hypothetical protein
MVAGLPMPDQIGAYQASGVTYLVTANEGDARTDDGDISRLAAATLDGTLASLLPDSILGRLNISTRDGDTNTDGDIDVPTMFGTRSFTIWNATTGLKVWDSGSLEPLLAALNPALHNMNDGLASKWDERSDDKGPEPEAVTIGTFGSSTFAFVGLERQNGILVYDVSVPTNPIFMGYQNNSLLTPTVISPESLIFIPADKNATLQPLLISGYEGTGTANTSGIVVSGDVVKYNPDEILVYKLTNSRNWTQEETFYPGTLTPQPRQTRAGIVKDTSYLVFNRNTNQIKTLRQQLGAQVSVTPQLGTWYLTFNQDKPPFNDARVRRALSMVLDREFIADQVWNGSMLPGYSFVPPGTNNYGPQIELSFKNQSVIDREEAAKEALLLREGFKVVGSMENPPQVSVVQP